MMKYNLQLLTLSCIIISLMACQSSQTTPDLFEKTAPSKTLEYKRIDDISLSLHVFNPKNHKVGDNRPAIVFFHGGGWNGGSPRQFYKQSQYLADRGMVAISAEYRVKTMHNTTPKESVKDGKSAMRWVHSHANELGINPKMIAAGGGSAGGQVAAATGTATTIEEVGEDRTLIYRPAALVLFNPVFDNGPNGYGYDRVKDYWQEFSPLHNITKNTPPTIGFFGEEDNLIKIRSALEFQQRMKELGGSFEIHIYEGQGHGFFNQEKYRETLFAMDAFLTAQGFIQ